LRGKPQAKNWQAASNALARRGYSCDKRGDCKRVNIALVVSRCGLPLGYEVFAGNRPDVTTVEHIVRHVVRQIESIWCASCRMRFG
jgi:transposase